MSQEENIHPSPSTLAGERLRTARKQRNWSQAELGKRSGISKVMIAQWETSTRKPGVDSLYTLAKTLEVSFAWLAVGEGDQTLPLNGVAPGQSSTSHNPELSKACVEMVLEFMHTHNLASNTQQVPELTEDLYSRAAQEGLDKANRTREAFKLALKDLVTIKLHLA